MRILTNSSSEAKGLISIVEASDNIPQFVVFCIPIDLKDAERLIDLYDFQKYFSGGISTKIKNGNNTNTLHLDYISPIQNGREVNFLPKFVANIKGYKIDFYLSPLNFSSVNNRQILNIAYFYTGNNLSNELFNKRLIILEPDWQKLDKLFLEERLIFVDWK